MGQLLDAYQEDLLNLSDLRERPPAVKKKIAALESERQNLGVRALEDQTWIEINQSLESFVARLNQTAQKLTTAERQKIVRLLIKQIDVGKETITIHHSIPIEHERASGSAESSPLYKRRLSTPFRTLKYFLPHPARCHQRSVTVTNSHLR